MTRMHFFTRGFSIATTIAMIAAIHIAAFSAFAESTTPLKVEDALNVKSLADQNPIGISPDGEWVAYTVKDSRKRQSPGDRRYSLYTKSGVYAEAVGCDVWITNTVTGETQNLTEGKGTSWSPVWSPDGKYLAFYSDRDGVANLWLWDRSTNRLHLASNAIVRPFFNSEVARWSSDSRQVLFKALPEHLTLEQATDLIWGPAPVTVEQKVEKRTGVTATVYSFTPEDRKAAPEPVANTGQPSKNAWMNRYLADLAVLDVATGKVHRIANGRMPMGYWFSPDNRSVAYTHFKSVDENTHQIVYELSIVSILNGAAHVLVPELRQEDGGSVSWSPDSKQLAYITSGPNTQADCFVLSLESGESRNLTGGKFPLFGDPNGDENRPPLWDSHGQNFYLISAPHYGQRGSDKIWRATPSENRVSEVSQIPGHVILNIVSSVSGGRLWSPDVGHSILVTTKDDATEQIGFYRIDVRTGKVTKLFEQPISIRQPILDTDVSNDGRIAYVGQDAGHPEDLWILEDGGRVPRKVTTLNPQFEKVTMGTSRTISWRSLDGVELHGALLLPANYKEGVRYPLIVNVYGGADLSDVVNRFGFGGDAAENMQILATRGFAVLFPDSPLRKGTPMQDLLKTVLPGVNRVIELGIADTNRLGIMGHSYGGYSTLALIVQSRIFKAAVDSAGVASLISEYTAMTSGGDSAGIGWTESGQGGMPGTPWQYRSTYIENSPLFYMDKVETPLLIVHGALDDSVPATEAESVFVSLRRLGKEVVYVRYGGEGHWEGGWGPDNVVDYWNRVISWFDEHLKQKS